MLRGTVRVPACLTRHMVEAAESWPGAVCSPSSWERGGVRAETAVRADLGKNGKSNGTAGPASSSPEDQAVAPGSRLLGTRALRGALGDPGSRVTLARRERSFEGNQTDRQTLCCFPRAISQSREPREDLVAHNGRSCPADVRPAEGPQGSVQESERKQAGPGRSSPRSPRGCTGSRAPER